MNNVSVTTDILKKLCQLVIIGSLVLLPHLNTALLLDGYYRPKTFFVSMMFFFWFAVSIRRRDLLKSLVFFKNPLWIGCFVYLIFSTITSLRYMTNAESVSHVLLEWNIFISASIISWYLADSFPKIFYVAARISAMMIIVSVLLPEHLLSHLPFYTGWNISTNPNFRAQYYIILMPILLEDLLIQSKPSMKIMDVVSLIFIGIQLFATNTTGALIGFFVSMIFFVVIFNTSLPKKMILLFILGFIIIATSVRYRNELSLESAGASFRLYSWESTMAMYRQNILSGVGVSNFYKQFPYFKTQGEERYYAPATTRIPYLRNPHCDFMMILSERGILGIGAFCYLLVLWFFLLANSSPFRAYSGLNASSVATLTHAMFSSNLSSITPLFFFVIIALSPLHRHPDNIKTEIIYTKSRSSQYRGAEWVLFIILFLIVGYMQSRRLSASYLNLRGSIRAASGYYNYAIDDYTRAKHFYPDTFEPYFFSGQVYQLNHQYIEAENEYITAIKKWRGYKETYLNLGRLYLAKGDLTNSMLYAKNFLALSSSNIFGMILLGDIYRAFDDIDKAKHWYQESTILSDNENTEASTKLQEIEKQETLKNDKGILANALLIKEEGNKFFQLASQADDRHDTISAKKFYLLAKNTYLEALKMNPYYMDALNNLASVEMRLGNPSRAITFYERAIKINPKYPTAYRNIAVVYHSYGDFVNATYYFKKYLDFDASSIEERQMIETELKRIKDMKH